MRPTKISNNCDFSEWDLSSDPELKDSIDKAISRSTSGTVKSLLFNNTTIGIAEFGEIKVDFDINDSDSTFISFRIDDLIRSEADMLSYMDEYDILLAPLKRSLQLCIGIIDSKHRRLSVIAERNLEENK